MLLILSSSDQVSKAILGPGNGSISKEIAVNFPVVSGSGQSELCLAGLTLFATTLAFGLCGRYLASRVGGEMSDRPVGRPLPKGPILELFGSAAAALAIVWLAFAAAGLSASFGLFLCSLFLFLILYWIESRVRHGALAAKDRLGAAAVWSAAAMAAIALVAVIVWVLLKGTPIALSHFPDFLTHDTIQGNPLTGQGDGIGQAIVGTMEQVAIASIISVPLAFLTATYLVESRSFLSRTVRVVIDAMTGTPSIIAGLFVYLVWVAPHGTTPSAKNGAIAGVTLAVMMLPVVTERVSR